MAEAAEAAEAGEAGEAGATGVTDAGTSRDAPRRMTSTADAVSRGRKTPRESRRFFSARRIILSARASGALRRSRAGPRSRARALGNMHWCYRSYSSARVAFASKRTPLRFLSLTLSKFHTRSTCNVSISTCDALRFFLAFINLTSHLSAPKRARPYRRGGPMI